MSKTVKEHLQTYGINVALGLLKDNPDENLPKLMSWVDRLDRNDDLISQRQAIHKILDDPENHWNKFIKSFWTDVDEEVRKTFFQNFIANSAVVGMQRLNRNREKYSCNIPWAILMDPTSACNLKCTGCWASEYGDKLSMSYETLNKIVLEGKELGTYMYIYSGGEPLVRKKDIIRLCKEHSDCMFLAFTNGTLIDEEFADEMLRVKNFVPAISIEGFEEETDDRRGKGTYSKVIEAMRILKEKKLIFGASCCYTSKNTNVIGSEEYFDDLIEKGAKFAWFFTYMPVGIGAPTDLIASAEQRKYMYEQIRKFRKEKSIFTLDFWNDGEYSLGCIAGGRAYMHINANGDIEPCAFIHYSDSSIYEKTLLEAYKSPLFMQYRKNQPFNSNHLRPCPLLDNPDKLADMVYQAGAYSTDLEQPENVSDLCRKCHHAAEAWKPVADELWAPNVREESKASNQ